MPGQLFELGRPQIQEVRTIAASVVIDSWSDDRGIREEEFREALDCHVALYGAMTPEDEDRALFEFREHVASAGHTAVASQDLLAS